MAPFFPSTPAPRTSNLILRVAVPSPLRRLFDYLAPAGAAPRPGMRVRLPFGKRETVGVVVEVAAESDLEPERLKPATALMDTVPLLDERLMALLTWATDYYHHAPGEVFATALPVALRQGEPAEVRPLRRYRLAAPLDGAILARAPRQQAVAALLAAHPEGIEGSALNDLMEEWRAPMEALVKKGAVTVEERLPLPAPVAEPAPAPELNPAQRAAVEAVTAAAGRFAPFLLDGVTGSGKTEVYLHTIASVVARGEQALVLVPEIGLTPQLVERFRQRFAVPVAVLHSGLADGERLAAWLAARDGVAPILIGTRSAIFTPFAKLGLIVVDEEHDASFKQQEGFRYSARDVAVMRAHQTGIPVVLGSATPSLETLHNALEGRYGHLSLPERAGTAAHPVVRLVDLRALYLEDGLSPTLLRAMEEHLARQGQVLLFLNRRGYAPVLLCHECGHLGECRRCDARLTLHAGDRRLRCHHCGAEQPVPAQCPACGSPDLRAVGRGTERIEEALQARFGAGVVRIDRDATRRKGSLESKLDQIRAGEARILVGTQMLAKGHDFPNVTLVGIVDADGGLFSADFRATERMAQLIVQVAGRAGRAERRGEVLIQTWHPDHPLLQRLTAHDYAGVAAAALAERAAAGFPPFTFLALLRAEAATAEGAHAFLEAARVAAEGLAAPGVELWGPVAAPMERRAGRYRAQLLVQAKRRTDLHRLLTPWAPLLEQLREGRRARWSLDVDPAELW
jgi:primosomal protein N' (replication factor Y)